MKHQIKNNHQHWVLPPQEFSPLTFCSRLHHGGLLRWLAGVHSDQPHARGAVVLLSHCRFSTAGAPPSLGQPSSEEGSYCNHTQPRYPSTGFQLAISPHTHKDRRKQAKPQLERKETLSSSYPLTVKSNHFPRRQAATQPVWFLAVLPLSPSTLLKDPSTTPPSISLHLTLRASGN